VEPQEDFTVSFMIQVSKNSDRYLLLYFFRIP
jgi:hypothetical protein